MTPTTTTVLRARRMLDVGAGALIDDPVLVIEGDRITDRPGPGTPAPDGAQEIDLGELTLMPGLIDAHMHFWGADSSRFLDYYTNDDAYRALWSVRDASDLLQAGITSVRCCGGFVGPQLTRAIAEGLIAGPRVVPAGRYISQRGGTWDPSALPEQLIASLDVYADGEDECRRAVRRRLRQGSAFIKIGLSAPQPGDLMPGWGDDPYRQRRNYTVGEVRAVAQEAHEAGVILAAHAIGEAAVTLALDGGVDTIEHGHGITDETRRRLADAGTVVVATLNAHRPWIDNGPAHGLPAPLLAVSRRHFDVQVQDFARGVAAGVTYALGSDAMGRPLGSHAGNVAEYELAVAHGMAPAEALRAGLQTGASVLGLSSDLGELAPGRLADVIAVDGDPLTDISAVRRVRFVMTGGSVARHDPVPPSS